METNIENYLIREVKKRGGIALKHGQNGYPDRIILLPERRIGFIETKDTGKQLEPLQRKRKRQLEELGFLSYKLDTKDDVEAMLNEIQSTQLPTIRD